MAQKNPWEVADAAREAVQTLLGPGVQVSVDLVGEGPLGGGRIVLHWERVAMPLMEVAPGVYEGHPEG